MFFTYKILCLDRAKNTNSSQWSSSSNQNSFMSQLSLPNSNNGGTIGEQLWGVRSSSSRSGTSSNIVNNQVGSTNGNQLLLSQSANLTRNSTSFATNPILNQQHHQQQQQQQQQFFRSNSWNVNGQQGANVNSFSVNQDGRVNFGGPSVSVNGGHFLLVKNITPQVNLSFINILLLMNDAKFSNLTISFKKQRLINRLCGHFAPNMLTVS